MQTPQLSAVLPVAPKHPVRTGGEAGTEAGAPKTSFSHVLTDQHARKTSTQSPHDQAAHQAPGKKDSPPAKAGTADADGEALARDAAEQGMTLPQIALNIAAEVAAVRQTGLATALKNHGIKTPSEGIAAQLEQDVRRLPSRLPQVADTAATLVSAPQPERAGTDVPANVLASVLHKAQTPAGTTVGTPPRGISVQQPLLSTGKAASIAGARQAVLTMQARLQAGDGTQPKVGAALPEVFTPFAAVGAPVADAFTPPGTSDAGSLLAAVTMPTSNAANSQASLLMPQPGLAAGLLGQPPAINAPLHSPHWSSELGRQFVSITQGGHNMPHTAELRLDPPELGPLRISINLNDNVAHAVFVSAHASVRQSVENALPQLQQMLAQAGISLGQTSVNDQGQPGQAFNDSADQGQQGRSADAGIAGGGSDALALSPVMRSPAPDALVDTFA